MTVWVRRTIIVPVAHAEFARNLCALLAGQSGAGMFYPMLHTNGVHTHYINGPGFLGKEFTDLLKFSQYPVGGDPIHTPGQPATVAAMAIALGMPTTAAQVQALFDASDITDEDGATAMARLGLSIPPDAP